MKITSSQIENYINRIENEKIAGCLVYGPEAIVVRARFEIIAKKIVKDLSDGFLVSNLSEEKLENDNALLADEFYSIPMFGGRKLIIIKDASTYTAKALKQITEQDNYSQKSDNFILVQADDLPATSALRKIFESQAKLASIACYEDNEAMIKKFVGEKFKENNLKYSTAIVDLVIERIGKNRQALTMEIEKISQFFAPNTNITLEKVAEILVEQNEISVNQFVVNFADKKFADALVKANKIIDQGEIEIIFLLRVLSNYFQKLYQGKIMIELDKISVEEVLAKQKIFFKMEADFRRHLKDLRLKFIAKILQDLEQIEIKIKLGKMSPKLIFLSYIANKNIQIN